MRWLARLGFALVVIVTASAAWGACPAQADREADKIAAPGVLLERPGAADDSEIAVDRPGVVIPWLLRVCVAREIVVRLPDVELRGPRGETGRCAVCAKAPSWQRAEPGFQARPASPGSAKAGQVDMHAIQPTG